MSSVAAKGSVVTANTRGDANCCAGTNCSSRSVLGGSSGNPGGRLDAGSSDSGSHGACDEDYLAEKLTLLLLLQPASAWDTAAWENARDAAKQWETLLDITGHGIVQAEVGCGFRVGDLTLLGVI